MNLKNFYKAINGNYKDTKSRLVSDSLIERFILLFKDDNTIKYLINSYQDKDIDNAFLAAHSLKGICANLGFGDLGKEAYILTEILRKKSFEGSKEAYDNVLKKYDILINGIEKHQ